MVLVIWEPGVDERLACGDSRIESRLVHHNTLGPPLTPWIAHTSVLDRVWTSIAPARTAVAVAAGPRGQMPKSVTVAR